VLSSTRRLHAGDKGTPVNLHVREVHRTEDEATEKGTMYHITAVVESKTVVYKIKCDEFLSMEKHDFTMKCSDLSAGQDYPAHLFVNAISFWQPEQKGDGYIHVAYDIMDEKEK
jgi:hypothetical protein